jgi:glycerophosphoryl diester phosphodiesterase
LSVWATSPVVVGHRGGRGDGWPQENTLDAFERARREGALAIELDVRTCAGGNIVVFHDATLSRMAKGSDERLVSDVPLEELRAMGVPTLEEALAWARSNAMAVNVELKHEVPDLWKLARGTARAVLDASVDVLVSSFDPRLLAMVALLASKLPRALLVRARQPFWADAAQRAARPPFVRWLHLERTQVHATALASPIRRGLRLGVWTVNDASEAVELVRRGASSIITDTPGTIARALALTRS